MSCRCRCFGLPKALYDPHHRILRSITSKGGSSLETTWARGAEKVKNTDVTNPYLEAIRKTHDPIQHIKTIEDELKGTIGKALGKQGEKILRALRSMQEQRDALEAALQNQHKPSHEQLQSMVQNYNEFREQALTARWELTVHRQAAGFIIGNHQYVTEAYPIPDKLLPQHVSDQDSKRLETNHNNNNNKKHEKQMNGQLEWWEKVGRWR